LNQRLKNAFENSLGPLKDFVIPKSDDVKSTSRQKLRSLEIIDETLKMLPAIELDDKPCSHAHEVGDVSAERDLPSELITAHLMIAQVIPETPFGICRVCA
jgi:hypothetical protein